MEVLRGRSLAFQCAKEGGRIEELLSSRRRPRAALVAELHLAKELLILAGLELYTMYTPCQNDGVQADHDGATKK